MYKAMGFVFVWVLGFGMLGCGSRQFTQGSYDDISEDRLLDDKFNESDMRQIADTMVKSLTESLVIREAKKPPIVLVTLVKNRSQEHIDMKSMTDKIKVALIKSGRFKFTEKENREEMAEETEYQGQSGYVDSATARKKGRQIGAQFFLTGEITDRVQEVGSKKYVYYKCTFNLVNIETGILEWADDKEIRKFYTKKSVGF
ncbi:MAG: penicillin-binding protein activator LpoB [Proteobacteria bacterium]|nr:penicillin-binding protein activator LpoB [Pseudomonadota bacterium]NQW43959.1 penicillin-binding protein activator LpoB [Deltaproteobacteria bacterium]